MHNELVAGSFSATLLRNLAMKLLYIRTQYSIIAPLVVLASSMNYKKSAKML
jgi:hypothetical protein